MNRVGTTVVLVSALAFAGCATRQDPAFHALTTQVNSLVREKYPGTKIVSSSRGFESSFEVENSMVSVNNGASGKPVWIPSAVPKQDGFIISVRMPVSIRAAAATFPKAIQDAFGIGYIGYAYLKGNQQLIEIFYHAGPNIPEAFSSSIKTLLEQNTNPYHSVGTEPTNRKPKHLGSVH